MNVPLENYRMNQKNEIPHVTEHAIHRAKERIGWNADAVSRMAVKAFNEGIQHSETSGRLNRYFTALYFKSTSANNIRIYGEHVFLFCDSWLVTVIPLPRELGNSAHSVSKKKKSNA